MLQEGYSILEADSGEEWEIVKYNSEIGYQILRQNNAATFQVMATMMYFAPGMVELFISIIPKILKLKEVAP